MKARTDDCGLHNLSCKISCKSGEGAVHTRGFESGRGPFDTKFSSVGGRNLEAPASVAILPYHGGIPEALFPDFLVVLGVSYRVAAACQVVEARVCSALGLRDSRGARQLSACSIVKF